jgi:hypothetical protein
MCRLSWNLGASNSLKSQGLSRPVMGLHYLFYYYCYYYHYHDCYTRFIRRILCFFMFCWPCILCNLGAQCFLNMFETFFYMFPATMCPSSGEITVPIRHLVFVILYSDKYHVSHRYGNFFWWWAHCCQKHVEKRNKYTGCPTRYLTQHFFNNSNTNKDIAIKFEH